MEREITDQVEKDSKELGDPLIVRKQEGWKRTESWSLMWPRRW